MDFVVTGAADSREVKLKGSFTFSDNDAFRRVVEAINGAAGSRIVLDMGELEFIDSAGLGMLLLASDAAEKSRVALKLRGPRGQVERMLKISRFDRIIPVEA